MKNKRKKRRKKCWHCSFGRHFQCHQALPKWRPMMNRSLPRSSNKWGPTFTTFVAFPAAECCFAFLSVFAFLDLFLAAISHHPRGLVVNDESPPFTTPLHTQTCPFSLLSFFFISASLFLRFCFLGAMRCPLSWLINCGQVLPKGKVFCVAGVVRSAEKGNIFLSDQ